MIFLTYSKKNIYCLLSTQIDVLTVLVLNAPQGRGLAVTKEIVIVYYKDVLFRY